MKKAKWTIAPLLVLLATSAFGQKIKVLEGDLSILKGQDIVNISYDYENLSVAKFENEEDYIAKKVAEYNADEPGRGDKWQEAWIGDRVGRYQPQFELLINKHLEKANIYVGNEKKAKYTMIVHTTFVEPGFNIYVSKKPAMVDLVIDVVETDNPDKVVCKIVSKGNPGRTYGMSDFDTGIRISEAYAMAGKELGGFITKALK